jgi:DNA repair exonuclease SbcCD ATPase subunit
MKKVTLKNMHLVNFRGHKDLKVNFSDQTTISGDNRLGKSTIFDAFVWALFGKDQFDRKDFEIIPIVDGKRADRVDPEVTVTIDVDGREIVLKRSLHQKWVRRRGTAEEVFDGCDTLYYFNDVPLKAGEYKARVDLLIEETIFKLITNPSTFLGLHWIKQREFLFQIAGTVSDVEVAASKPEFSKLLEMVNGKSLVEYKKEISARKKNLKADLEDIQPRIDQTSRLMPEAQEWAAIEAEIANVEAEINAIDELISDRAKAIRSQYDDIQAKQSQINDLKSKQQSVVNAANAKAQQNAFDANMARNALSNDVTGAQAKLNESEAEVSTANIVLSAKMGGEKAIEKEIEALREKWNTENSKEYTAKEGCLICPVFHTECSDQSATEKHTEAQEKAKQAFFDTKQTILNSINETGKKKSEELAEVKKQAAEAKDKVTESKTKLETAKENYNTLLHKLTSTSVVSPDIVQASDLPEWQDLQKQIEDVEATIAEVKSVDSSDQNTAKAELNVKRDNLKKQLQNRELITRYKAEIQNLEAHGKDLSQQIADLESQEFTIDAFNKVKIDEADKRVNRMFEIVKFQLYDKTNDGNEFEVCIALNKSGIPIAATNTAEKINAGLDIIRTLSNFYNVSAPIFCDQAESNNNYLRTGSQMVFLRVTTEKQLTISNN